MYTIKNYLVRNECYIKNIKLEDIRGVLIHSTATPGATPEDFVKAWNVYRPNKNQVCVHAFCDDTKVIQTLPYNIKCWGCGGSGNSHYIQLEICEPRGVYYKNGWEYSIREGCEDYVKNYINKAADIVVEWIVDTLLSLGITTINKNTVTSHYEAYKLNMASNHGDPKGLLELVELSMDDIRDRAQALMDIKLKDNTNIVKSKVYKIRVNTEALNIRSGPGTAYNITGCIRDRGIYTIVNTDSSGKWGKLKSGAGWIHLGYTKKI